MLDSRAMALRDASRYQYGDNDDRPHFLNEDHYRQAFILHTKFVNSIRNSTEEPAPQTDIDLSALREPRLAVPEENRLLPVDGYFSFYSDLLGFTKEVSNGGMDSLPDYFGGAFGSAALNPSVSAYLFSDSSFAFARAEDTICFVRFYARTFSRWLSNGLIPRCSIGYGSFVSRNPFPDNRPPNFFGTQITGTAVSDAAGVVEGDDPPRGSRILMSESAWRHLPGRFDPFVASNGGLKEFFPERHRTEYLFDCVYYLLCLRDHEPSTDPFNHYVWSFASRAKAAGTAVARVATDLAAPHCDEGRLRIALDRILEIVRSYQSVTPRAPATSAGEVFREDT